MASLTRKELRAQNLAHARERNTQASGQTRAINSNDSMAPPTLSLSSTFPTTIPDIVSEVVEQVINVTMDCFTVEPEPVAITAVPKDVVRKVKFADDVPDHLVQAYYLEEYLEHMYDIKGVDNTKKLRFKGSIKVDVVAVDKKNMTTPTGYIVISEKRGRFRHKIVKTYHFDNPDELQEFYKYFDSDEINKMYMIYSGVKAAGGSIIKAIIRGEAYIDKYYDRIEGRPKFNWKKGLSKALTMFTSAVIATAVTILL